MFKEFQDTEKRIKELKEKGGIQRQVRAQEAAPVTRLDMPEVMGCAVGHDCHACYGLCCQCLVRLHNATTCSHVADWCLLLQAELMYRRNKEEVEGLQNKRKQVCNDDPLSLWRCVLLALSELYQAAKNYHREQMTTNLTCAAGCDSKPSPWVQGSPAPSWVFPARCSSVALSLVLQMFVAGGG